MNPADEIVPKQAKRQLDDAAAGPFDSLKEQLRAVVERPSPWRKPEEKDELVERNDRRLGIISNPDQEISERQTNYDLSTENKKSRRSSRGFARYLVASLIGITAALAWQSYGDVAKQMIATSIQRLGWTKPPVVESKAAPVEQSAPATPSIDAEQIHQMARDLATLRQTVEQLAAGLDQVTREIGKLEAADVQISSKITPAPPAPRPIAAPARKSTPKAPSSQVPAAPPTSLAPVPPPDQ